MLLALTTTINAQTAAKKPVAKTQKTTTTTKKTAEPAATTFKDERDGQVYKTTVIEGKTWMVEPFRYKPEKCDCIYWEEKDTTKGAFYTPAQAKRVVPAGWRVPTTEEYEALLAKLGTTKEGFAKAGFAVEFLKFDLAMYKTIRQYKNDAYMTKVLVGDKKAFNVSDNAYFLAQKSVKNKMADGTETETVFDWALLVKNDASQMSGVGAGDYIRLFLIKE